MNQKMKQAPDFYSACYAIFYYIYFCIYGLGSKNLLVSIFSFDCFEIPMSACASSSISFFFYSSSILTLSFIWAMSWFVSL